MQLSLCDFFKTIFLLPCHLILWVLAKDKDLYIKKQVDLKSSFFVIYSNNKNPDIVLILFGPVYIGTYTVRVDCGR